MACRTNGGFGPHYIGGVLMKEPKKVPFVTECCGKGCGQTLKLAWLDEDKLSSSALEQYYKYGKVVSHGMCGDCQVKYYGKTYK